MRPIQPLVVTLAFAMLSATAVLRAQHTFSIVAVDPETGEVGSAGASCLPIDVSLISDVHPGVGAIHTQALYNAENQAYGGTLMDRGMSARVIIDSLVDKDVEGNPGIRQYGVITLDGTEKSAGYTGSQCMDYKNHVTGLDYSIQGNILLGQSILDSMRARFVRTQGTLADRLMSALQGANVPGADTRCAPNASSQAAFLRVAKPGDDREKLWLDLRVVLASPTTEPLDSLQRMYDRWKLTTNGVARSRAPIAQSAVLPNPASATATAEVVLAAPAAIDVALFDLHGRRVLSAHRDADNTDAKYIPLNLSAISSGVYYCRISAAGQVETMRLVVTH